MEPSSWFSSVDDALRANPGNYTSEIPGDQERKKLHQTICEREKLLRSRPLSVEDYILDLRRLTLQVVEEITLWRKAMSSSTPSLSLPSILASTDSDDTNGSKNLLPNDAGALTLPYFHKGENYLMKVGRRTACGMTMCCNDVCSKVQSHEK